MSETSEPEEAQIFLSPQALDAARQIQKLANLDTIEDAIRVALGDELYIRQEIKKGRSVLLKENDNYWEVDWRSIR